MSEDRKELPASSLNRAWPQYGAAFMMATSLSMAWTAMPFVLSTMGGTNAHVGYAPAVNTFAYMMALLVTGSRCGHLRVRRTTLGAATVALLATAAMSFTVLWARSHPHADGLIWIWTLIVAGGIGGAAMALYWPFLMTWVSADYEGVPLNRRFGRYNGAWSGGATIGPLLGGWLFEVNAVLPLSVAVAFVLLSLLLLSFGRDGSARKTGASSAGGLQEATCDLRLLADCRWMSRVALFSACACYAVLRSQFALVFTGLGYTESQFGLYLTVYALCNFAALVAAGRWALWHFRPSLLFVGQAMLLVMLLLTIYGKALSLFFTASVMLGIAYGFAYCSHLYYGASASRKRSTRMAIHEIVISLGLTIGSLAGGYLAEHVGLYTPYWFALGLVGLGTVVQMAIHIGARPRTSRAGPGPAARNVGFAKS
ncbi:MAG: MFS transporter [Phycisphaerae bacterium]|nr:MFS transporter [Phycisphaerae bacterium]